MKLGETVEVVVGTCIEDIDPKKLGRIKVGAPGWFDRNVMSIEAIPWVYPFSMAMYNSFTHIALGGKVWLIINKENEEEYWYVPYHELNDDTRQVQGADIDEDIVFSRNINGKVVQVYQNKEDGLVLRNGGSSVIISNDGDVTGTDGSGAFKVSGGNFFCGAKDGPFEPMVRGNVCYELLMKLSSDFANLSSAASSSPYTSVLVDPFKTAGDNISQALKDLKSTKANVSE